MNFSLKTKLSGSYILIVIVCIVSFGVLTNFLISKYFKDYVINNQESKNIDLINSIKLQYKNDTWDKEALETIGVNFLENGKIVKVLDKNGDILWDATLHNNGMCNRIIESMSDNMESIYPNFGGSYEEKPYKIKIKNFIVGTAIIGSYGPFYYNEADIIFIDTLNKFLLLIALLAFVFALIVGNYMSNHLSLPILKVIDVTEMISNGFYSERIESSYNNFKSNKILRLGSLNLFRDNTIEIDKLKNAINELAKTLENQEIIKKRITQDVAHELRTPLAALQSHMEAMIDGVWEADKLRLTSCQDEIIRLKSLVDDLEKLAKYESDNILLDISSFDLKELIENILMNFEIEFKKISMNVILDIEKSVIYADKNKISQVIINIISNSIKYSKENCDLKIQLTSLEQEYELIIEDNGIGIPENDIKYVFERFYRVDKSRSRLNGGSGIGLTIAKAIIVAHKGYISIKSNEEKGTKVKNFIEKTNKFNLKFNN